MTLHETGNDFICRSAKELQAAAQGLVQARKRMMQPPAGGGADPVLAGGFIVKDIDRQDTAGFGGPDQGGIVVEAQVLAEPDDGDA